MNPDLDLRLKSVMKALSDVVLPALPAGERMARDQVNLALGHLAIIAEQWPYALRFELAALDESLALAAEMLGLLEDDAQVAMLESSLARAATLDREDYADVAAFHRALKDELAQAVEVGAGARPLSGALIDAVLCHNARRAPRERSWCRASGLDPDGPRLPPLRTLFEDGQR